jgi:phosphatidylglycerol:prolipoprotein diacylglycerol transferase
MIPADLVPVVLFLGPLRIPVFGVLVMTGVFVGHALVLRLARERGLEVEEMRGAALWALVFGFAGAHWADVLLYRPDKLQHDGLLALLKVWDGISSWGGFTGALAGTALYFHRLGKRWWEHADLLLQGLVAGWLFGRLGCTLTLDHPGRVTDFPLAFFSHGVARHNLGFYELLYTLFVVVPGVLVIRSWERAGGVRPGCYVSGIVLLYAPGRFAMDFLRATDLAHADPRWFGLTPAQYACLIAFALALGIAQRIVQSPTAAPRRAQPGGGERRSAAHRHP